MKRFALFLALTLMLSLAATAQITFGFKGGLNFTNFTSARKSISFHNSTGWHLGVVSQVAVPVLRLSMQPELIYTLAKASEGSIGYVQIPFNVRYMVVPGNIRVLLLVGPHVGYATNFSGMFNSSSYMPWDWGFGFGSAVEYKKFQLAGKYSWGLQNISRTSDTNLQNSAFALSLAYFL